MNRSNQRWKLSVPAFSDLRVFLFPPPGAYSWGGHWWYSRSYSSAIGKVLFVGSNHELSSSKLVLLQFLDYDLFYIYFRSYAVYIV